MTTRSVGLVVAAAAVVALAGCGDDGDSEAESGTGGGTGTVAVRLEPTDAIFIEGFEVGLRFTDADGDEINRVLWSDFVLRRPTTRSRPTTTACSSRRCPPAPSSSRHR